MNKLTKGIKNIIFDLGGVVINIDYDLTVKEFAKLDISDFQNQFSQYQQTSFFNDFETGKITDDEFFQFVQNALKKGLPKTKIENAWNAMLLDIPKARIELIERLSKDYNVYLLSNTNSVHFRSFNQQFIAVAGKELHAIFKKAYLSHEIGRRKPDADTFLFVLQDAGIDAQETLFIDDTKMHVDGASSVGINAYLLQKNEDILDLFN